MAVATLLLSFGAAVSTALVANPPSFPAGTEFTVRRMELDDPRLEPAELQVTDHVVRLRRENAVSISSVYVQAMRKQAWARTEADVRLGVSALIIKRRGEGRVTSNGHC